MYRQGWPSGLSGHWRKAVQIKAVIALNGTVKLLPGISAHTQPLHPIDQCIFARYKTHNCQFGNLLWCARWLGAHLVFQCLLRSLSFLFAFPSLLPFPQFNLKLLSGQKQKKRSVSFAKVVNWRFMPHEKVFVVLFVASFTV